MKRLFTMVYLVLLFTAFTFADVINVPGDQVSIQDGIIAAVNGDTVLVAEGTYLENINFMGKAIVVGSHYLMDMDTSHISNTIIDGSQPSNADSGSVVYFISGEDTTSVLYGFTITNGSGTITEYTWENVVTPVRAGGGILCYNSGARISDNKIMNNHIPDYSETAGGGVSGFPVGSTAHVIIEGNQIVYNSVTGVIAYSGGVDLTCNGTIKNNDISFNTANATNYVFGAVGCWSDIPRTVDIINNQISHNVANGPNNSFGGGVTIERGMNASVIDNKISYNVLNATGVGSINRGGGIIVHFGTGTYIIDSNIISNNMVNGSTAIGGGIALNNNTSNSNTLITNNIISGNSALSGGGIYSQSSKAQIINNTIVNNTAATQGGGLGATGTQPVVLNTIIWGNQAGTDPQLSGSMVVAYSNIQGGWEGEGNIDSNPLFSDTLFQLSEYSPCVGSGVLAIEIDENWYYSPDTDFNGNQRPNSADSYVDMGAWESTFPVKAYPTTTSFHEIYVPVNTGPIIVNTELFNPNNQNVTVYARITSSESSVTDSTEIFDDGTHEDGNAGDGLYGGSFESVTEEAIFMASIGIKYNTTDHYVVFNENEIFTSIGPLTVDHYVITSSDTIPNHGDRLPFDIYLKNEGSTATASQITATIESLDTCAIVRSFSFERTFGDIPPGENAEGNNPYSIQFSDACADSMWVSFKVDIYSDDYLFWSDTFSVFVHKDPTGIAKTETDIPREFALKQNYPNPFNPSTKIKFALPKPEEVKIEVFNTLGQRVEILLDKHMKAGHHEVEFNAQNLSSGIYYYRIEAGEFQDVKKMILLR